MNFDRTAVWFGMSETGRPSRRYPPAHLTAVSAVFGRTTFTGSECHDTANQATGARAGKRNAQPKRRRSSVMAIAFLAVLLPLGAVAESTPFVWPGGTTITVRDYTSDTFDGIVQKEVAAWSEIMPGGIAREAELSQPLIGPPGHDRLASGVAGRMVTDGNRSHDPDSPQRRSEAGH